MRTKQEFQQASNRAKIRMVEEQANDAHEPWNAWRSFSYCFFGQACSNILAVMKRMEERGIELNDEQYTLAIMGAAGQAIPGAGIPIMSSPVMAVNAARGIHVGIEKFFDFAGVDIEADISDGIALQMPVMQ